MALAPLLLYGEFSELFQQIHLRVPQPHSQTVRLLLVDCEATPSDEPAP